MGAFAAINMPVDLTKCRGAEVIASEVVTTFPGTRNVVLDSGRGVVSFDLHFPGNLSDLTERLRGRLIPVGEQAQISLPIRSLASGDPAKLAAGVEHGPEVWDVQFPRNHYVLGARMNGSRLEATIVPSTHAMHQIYDAALALGFVVAEDESMTTRGR